MGFNSTQNQTDPRYLRPTGKQLFLERPADFEEEEEEMDYDDDDGTAAVLFLSF